MSLLCFDRHYIFINKYPQPSFLKMPPKFVTGFPIICNLLNWIILFLLRKFSLPELAFFEKNQHIDLTFNPLTIFYIGDSAFSRGYMLLYLLYVAYYSCKTDKTDLKICLMP